MKNIIFTALLLMGSTLVRAQEENSTWMVLRYQVRPMGEGDVLLSQVKVRMEESNLTQGFACTKNGEKFILGRTVSLSFHGAVSEQLIYEFPELREVYRGFSGGADSKNWQEYFLMGEEMFPGGTDGIPEIRADGRPVNGFTCQNYQAPGKWFLLNYYQGGQNHGYAKAKINLDEVNLQKGVKCKIENAEYVFKSDSISLKFSKERYPLVVRNERTKTFVKHTYGKKEKYREIWVIGSDVDTENIERELAYREEVKVDEPGHRYFNCQTIQ